MKISKEFLLSMLILLAAIGFMRSLSHGEVVPLRQDFTTFPHTIETWTGRERTLDARVLEVLRVDDYLLRQYEDAHTFPIELYIGYYKSQRQGATYHSPKNCLPGSGWTFLDTGTVPLATQVSPAKDIDINKFIIQKGSDKQLVLYWYQDRGRVITSEYWAKVYLVWDAMFRNRTDGAFVRITVPFLGDEAAALTQGRLFAEKIFPILREYLPG